MKETPQNAFDDEFDDYEEDTQSNRFLEFQVETREYAIEISHVVEIVGVQKITEVPDFPNYVLGVVNLRGSIIPVIDVRLRFGFPQKDYNDRTCLIVAKINDSQVGLIVDSVREVVSIPPESVSPPPAISKDSVSKFVKGIARIGEAVVVILSLNELLQQEAIEQLSKLG